MKPNESTNNNWLKKVQSGGQPAAPKKLKVNALSQQPKPARIDIQELIRAVRSDSFLSGQQKQDVLNKLNESPIINKLTAGMSAGGTGYIIAKYLNLSKPAQILLAIAGYGIGRFLWEEFYRKDGGQNRFARYNDKLNIYEIQ